MVNNKQTISVIIPACNEEIKLKQCLESLFQQVRPVDEIIVISNGSSDDTARIARSFKSVKVLEINKRSLINARDIGFDMARGGILARINADVICLPNWSEVLFEDFSNSDVSAVAGLAKTWTMVFMPNYLTTFWSKIYLNYIEAFFGIPILWGSNMAIRKDSWLKIRNKTCKKDSEVHEDQDISIHLNHFGEKIIKDPRLLVINTEDSYFKWSKLKQYLRASYLTKKSHDLELSKPLYGYIFIRRIFKFLLSIIPGLVFFIASLVAEFFSWLWNCLFYKHR